MPRRRTRFRRGIGRTFQVAQTFLSMSAAENVQMALISRHGGRAAALWHAGPGAPSRRGHGPARPGRHGGRGGHRPCSALAYGDVKRVELAIALAGEPEAPSHGRAHRRHGAARARSADGPHRTTSRASRGHRRPLHRARHGRGVRPCGPGARAPARRDHRRGLTRRDPRRPAGAAGLSRRRACPGAAEGRPPHETRCASRRQESHRLLRPGAGAVRPVAPARSPARSWRCSAATAPARPRR